MDPVQQWVQQQQAQAQLAQMPYPAPQTTDYTPILLIGAAAVALVLLLRSR